MPAIDRLMAPRRPGARGSSTWMACSVGPGGYTGLRIATAAANMIALVDRGPAGVEVPVGVGRGGPLPRAR